jgi:hypothetical protein
LALFLALSLALVPWPDRNPVGRLYSAARNELIASSLSA